MTKITDLTQLRLCDGLPVQQQESSGRVSVRLKNLTLRETNVADQRWAVQQAERVVMVGKQPKLMPSDAEYDIAMTLRHCAQFDGDGITLAQNVLTMDQFAQLSDHDLGLIQERIFLLHLAAQVRYGEITQEEFDDIVGGSATPKPTAPTADDAPAALDAVGANDSAPLLPPAQLGVRA